MISEHISRERERLIQALFAEFLRHFITIDEIWIHHYTQRRSSSPNSGWKQVKVRQEKRKWFHPKEKPWLQFFWVYRLLGKRLHHWTNWRILHRLKQMLFHYDKALAHKSRAVAAKFHDIRFEVFAEFGSHRWLYFAKPEKTARWKKNFFKW